MKKASLGDYWRNLPRVVTAAKGITRLNQTDAVRKVLSFRPEGLFAVVGSNGAGKSSFFEFLTSLTYNRLRFMAHQVELADGTTFNIPGDTIPAILIDPYAELRRANYLLIQFKSTFGQKELSDISDKEKGIINYVLGSSYEKMQIEEVEVEGDEVCPRFVLLQGGREVDNGSLSLGEQLVLYLYWVLAKKHTDPGIYFVEEPEAGLSPSGQSRLVDLLAYLSVTTQKQLFIATHSPFIVEKLEKHRVILMKKPNHAEWIHANGSNCLDELGMALGRKGICFLEDNKAKVFIEKLLDSYGSSLRRTYDFIFLNGESDVYEVIHRIGDRSNNLKLIGILDADQKNQQRYTQSEGHFYFLPGELSPEMEVINAVKAHPGRYARALGVPVVRLSDAIRRCEGFEPHDFFEELSRALFGTARPQIYESAFGVWYANYPNKEEIHLLVKALDPEVSQEDIQAAEQLYFI